MFFHGNICTKIFVYVNFLHSNKYIFFFVISPFKMSTFILVDAKIYLDLGKAEPTGAFYNWKAVDYATDIIFIPASENDVNTGDLLCQFDVVPLTHMT